MRWGEGESGRVGVKMGDLEYRSKGWEGEGEDGSVGWGERVGGRGGGWKCGMG